MKRALIEKKRKKKKEGKLSLIHLHFIRSLDKAL